MVYGQFKHIYLEIYWLNILVYSQQPQYYSQHNYSNYTFSYNMNMVHLLKLFYI